MTIKIIGSSHIAKQSVESVKNEIENFTPDIIALELDRSRAYALLHPKQKPSYLGMLRSVGLKGFVFSIIGSFAQKKLGNIVGVEPGSEMKTALIISREKNIKTMFIDQDIAVTLKKFSKAITWIEKGRFVVDMIKAMAGKGPKLKFDLRKVPDEKIVKKLVTEVRERYPNVYSVLIDERNRIMAKRVYLISKNNRGKKVLAIVGVGHREEMLNLIKKYEREN